MILDFGNGIATDGVYSDIALESSGLDVPEFEVPVTENGVMDGGVVGHSRTRTRRMTVKVLHRAQWSREEIMRAFTVGIERILRGTRGMIPYYVEMLSFPLSMIEAELEFTVVLISPLAYPVEEARLVQTGNIGSDSGSISGGASYPLIYPAKYGNIEYSDDVSDPLYVDSGSDVECPVVATIIMLADAPDVALTIGDEVCTIVGALTPGDVVVIDSGALPHTVEVNGVNRLSWFAHESSWPRLQPGVNLLQVSRPAVATVVWSPRLSGLI